MRYNILNEFWRYSKPPFPLDKENPDTYERLAFVFRGKGCNLYSFLGQMTLQ